MKRNLLKLLTVVIAIISICGRVSAQTGKEIGMISQALTWNSTTDATYGKGYQCETWEGVTISLFKGTNSSRNVNQPGPYMGQNGGMVLIIDAGSQNMTTITLDYSSGSGFSHGLTPSTGSVTVDEETRTTTWTGNANKVVFTADYSESLYNKYERIFVYTDGATAPEIPNLTNTKETAYTATKAVELLSKYKKATQNVFVKGKVSAIKQDGNQLEKYGSITYYISETGKTSEPQFLIYSGLSINGDKFKSLNDLQVGDDVTVYGQMKYYGADLELNMNNKIVEYKSTSSFILDDGTYFIRNSEAGTFFAGANSWGTRLSLKSGGDEIIVKRKAGYETYTFEDKSLINKGTGAQIGEPNNDIQIFIDQKSPASGYKFHKLTPIELKMIDDVEGSNYSVNPDKEYFYISYVSDQGANKGKTMYMAQGNIGPSKEHEVSGINIDTELGRPDKTAIWEIFTRKELADDLYANATPEYPMSATPFITNPDFSRNQNAAGNANDNGWIVEDNISDIYGQNENFIATAVNKTFKLYQTITDLPNGTYKALASGVYEGSATGSGTNPQFYVIDGSGNKQYKTFQNVSGTKSTADWSASFRDGYTSINKDSINITVWDNTLTIGFEGGRTDVLAYFDNVQLFYLGKVADVSTLVKKFNGIRSQANSILKANKPMGAEYKEALQKAYNNIPDLENADELNTAIAEITKAMNDANNSINLYGTLVSKYQTEVNKLNSEAQQYYKENITDPIVNAGILQNEQQLIDGVNAAKIINAGKGADITSMVVVNPNFDEGMKGWVASGYDPQFNVPNNTNYPYRDGDRFVERWANAADLADAKMLQTINNLPSGNYKVTAVMMLRQQRANDIAGEGYYLVANDQKSPNTYEGQVVETNVTVLDGTLTFGVSYEKGKGNWACVDDFHLIYIGPIDVTELVDQLNGHIANADALLKKKMNSDVDLALRNAKKEAEDLIKSNSKNSDAYIAEISKLSAQNTAAQASVTVYENINTIIQKGTSELDKDGSDSFKTFITTVQDAWNNGKITDGKQELQNAQDSYVAAIKKQSTPGKEMTEAVADYECNSGYAAGQFGWGDRAQAVVKDWILLDADNNYEVLNMPESFHVNTWSNEAETGADGGTAMTVPFTEFWTDASNRYLQTHNVVIKHITETGYRPGRYTISIITRLAQCEAGATSPQGYKFTANGMESKLQFTHNTGANVFHTSDEVDFFVEEDGKIDFQFELNKTNFSWFSFKMIKLVYQGTNYNDAQAEEIVNNSKVNLGQPMNKAVEDKLKDAINAFQDNHSIENGKAVQKAAQEAKNSVELYEYVMDQINNYLDKEELYNGGEGFDDLGHKKFMDAIDAGLDAYDGGTLTEADRDLAARAFRNGLIGQAEGDFTELMQNPGFENGSSEGWKVDILAWGGETKLVDVNASPSYKMDPMEGNWLFNTWSGAGGATLSQTVTGLPAGKYRVDALMTSTNDGKNDVRTLHLTVGDYTASEPSLPETQSKRVSLEFVISSSSATITAWAATDPNATLDGTDHSWFKCDDFHLYYLGASDVDDLIDQLELACTVADQYIDKPMNKDILKPLQESYKKAKDIISTKNATADEIIALKDDVLKYANATVASIEVYKKVYSYYETAMTLDEDGQNTYRELAKDVIAAYQAGTITDGVEECSHLEWWLRTATKSQTSYNSNWTGAILNPSFESRMQEWKTQSGYKSFSTKLASDQAWQGVKGDRYAYRDNIGGSSKVKVNFYQDIDTVKIGVYKLNATVYTNSKTMQIYGNDLKQTLQPSNSPDEAREVEQIVVSWTGNRITLGFIGDLYKDEVIRVDNIRLTYVSKDIDIESEKVPDSIKYYNKLKSQQDIAVKNFHMDPQPEQLSAAIEAIRLAKESAEYYAIAKHYLDSCTRYMEHSNVYSQAAKDQCMKIWNELNNGYNAGSLTNDDCIKMLYQVFQNGFEGFNYSNSAVESTYSNYPILNYIFDAWTLNKWGDEIKANGNFHVNNWSTEIDPANPKEENSEMTTPFIEYWRNRSEGDLEDATISAKAINLEPGLYKMNILVRVANENGNVSTDDFDGINLHVTTNRIKENNGKTLFSSDTISVCKGEAHKDGNLNVVSQVFTVDSIIVREKDNKDADIHFEVEGTNANWLSWKFAQFVKIRNLGFDEENDLASDAEIKELRDLIARDAKKPIGFNMNEFSTYANKDMITAHNNAKKYLAANEIMFDDMSTRVPNHHLTKYQVNEYIKVLKDESKWIIQKGDTNCFYNPYFSLVKNNQYGKLFGWECIDPNVESPLTGGMGATSATADPNYTKFANTRKAYNANGEWNLFSTAAAFRFQEPNYFCSSSSVYNYGNEVGFEMPLDPDQAYTFTFQYGYLTPNETGSAIIEIVNKRTGVVVNKLEDRIWTPDTCVSDTNKIPQVRQILFNTPARSGKYSNSLENFEDFENYKVVIRNANPDQHWTMIISNIKLYRYPNALMKIAPGAHWGTFIAPFETKLPDGITAYVVTGKDSKAHDYIDPDTGEKKGTYTSLHLSNKAKDVVYVDKDVTRKNTYTLNSVIPPHVPVVIYTDDPNGYEGMVAGKNTEGERKDSVRFYRENNDHIYLEGHEGYLNTERPDSLGYTYAADGNYVLQLHKNEGAACFYVVDTKVAKPKVPANRCYLVDPKATSGSTRLRKLVFDLDEALEIFTSIENSDNQNEDMDIIGIYSVNGILQDELKPGINIIKMSDGSTRKKIVK